MQRRIKPYFTTQIVFSIAYFFVKANAFYLDKFFCQVNR
jgi:hypothetical protein